jgi:hypothetical protein
MTKQKAGIPTARIRTEIDAKYGKVGKPMPTPLPQ